MRYEYRNTMEALWKQAYDFEVENVEYMYLFKTQNLIKTRLLKHHF